MPTIIEFTMPGQAFPLGHLFEDFPDIEVELERVIPTQRRVIPYFWIWGSDIETIPGPFEGHPAVERIELVDTVPSGGLFRGEWDLEVDTVLKGIIDTDVVLLTGVGEATEWKFQLRADERTAPSHFQQYCREEDIPITVTRLYALSEMRTGESYQMTPSQEEALIAAFEAGYFNKPREAPLTEIADKIGISRQALAERLRRGYRNLIANTLITESAENSEEIG